MEKIYIDLSHIIEDGLVTYKGLPAPIICDYLSREASKDIYEEGTEFQIGKIEMVSNTGTYIDTPFHRYHDGKDLSEMELKSFAGIDAVVVNIEDKTIKAIDKTFFYNTELKGKAVLVHTGWDQHWNTEQYATDHPYLTEDAAQYLLEQRVALVGIDSMNIDSTKGKTRPVHSILLHAEIPIVEHLCHLEQLPQKPFLFYAVPPKIKKMGTFPVRAFAELIV
ncbi:cyclase family protein [Cohnella abietis]|uniref:Cyclase n=1 Tax=Cohnella abietis TaxID=2507935 RepID=A0A3T1D9Z1_9BACL|nr:cyclase family protein [Cohnella abietis]BBI34910.1 cyclase [Cohnella abietis]